MIWLLQIVIFHSYMLVYRRVVIICFFSKKSDLHTGSHELVPRHFFFHVLTSEDLERLLNQDRKVPILGDFMGIFMGFHVIYWGLIYIMGIW